MKLKKLLEQQKKFVLPDLPYKYDALEPYIDEETMKIHHDKHHAGYTDKLNDAITDESLEDKTIIEIFKNASKYSDAVINNGGGYWNHKLFWKVMSSDSKKKPEGELLNKINDTFKSFDKFKDEFSEAAETQFGSGWAWLIYQDGKLKITQTSNQNNPLMDITEKQGIPLLCLDVWEHAYYLKYQNKRPDYVEAFWNIINWDYIEKRFNRIKK